MFGQCGRRLVSGKTLAVISEISPQFSTSSSANKDYKLVVVGGGAGGCAVSSKFSSKLGKGSVAVIEPSDVLPKKADWIKDSVASFDPANNKVRTKGGQEIGYEYLVVAMGLQLNYNQIKGLPDAFETPGVGSIYNIKYAEKTYQALQNFKKGNAIFTFPNTPVKCAGAPQKIMYLSEHYFKKHGKRDQANIIYNTSLGVIFGVKKYAEVLSKIVQQRGITVNFRHNLIEVKPNTKEAIFQNLDKPEEKKTFQYEMLHIAPPMSAPDALRNAKDIVDENGFLALNKLNLQHVKYKNIFGLGDCTSLPTAKTAASVAAGFGVMKRNLLSCMAGKPLKAEYDGYTSCPLVTGYNKCILAEFDYDAEPLETFPFNQAKERRTMFHMKKDFMPPLYWHALVKGYWEGPGIIRKLAHLGFSK